MSGFLLNPSEVFSELVQEGLARRKVKAPPPVERYLVGLLEHYLFSNNLFVDSKTEQGQSGPTTLAEMYLLAHQKENFEKQDLLRRTGDRALYISGFFGDSLSRKIVDVDYYVQIGGAAYSSLSGLIKDGDLAQVYGVISRQFVSYDDVLTVISHKTMSQSDQGILRLYDRYLKTGSPLAKEQLVEKGLFHLASEPLTGRKKETA